ncbi:hypothetical protein RF11_16526 [Thelohanellus kitauei]|uniref:Uncharacterized protein n=1 Tax=Thelohanellus kitauei TaxID=669202 RepID=A0A0C2JHC7_THEKT|nr:hypothetical protein RF11_16526 [Thelohanellus kitauei]
MEIWVLLLSDAKFFKFKTSLNCRNLEVYSKNILTSLAICGDILKKIIFPNNQVCSLSYFCLDGLKANKSQSSKAIQTTFSPLKKSPAMRLKNAVYFIDSKIGRDGTVVEIDETKLIKNKHRRGHPVNRVYVPIDVKRTVEFSGGSVR